MSADPIYVVAVAKKQKPSRFYNNNIMIVTIRDNRCPLPNRHPPKTDVPVRCGVDRARSPVKIFSTIGRFSTTVIILRNKRNFLGLPPTRLLNSTGTTVLLVYIKIIIVKYRM